MQTKKFISFLYLKKNFTLPSFIRTYFTVLQYGVLHMKLPRTFKLQNKAMRVISNTSADPLFRKKKILKLEDKYTKLFG